MLCRGRDAHGKGASSLKSCTQAVCETEPRIVMRTECSRLERHSYIDTRGRSHDREVRVVTGRVEREFPVDVVPELAIPLEAVKCGGVWEIENPVFPARERLRAWLAVPDVVQLAHGGRRAPHQEDAPRALRSRRRGRR